MQFQCPMYRTQTPCKLCKLEGFSRCLAFDWESGGVPERTLQVALPLNNRGRGGALGTLSTLRWMFVPLHSPGNLVQPPGMQRRLPRTTLLAGCIRAYDKMSIEHHLGTGCWVHVELGHGCWAPPAELRRSRRQSLSSG